MGKAGQRNLWSRLSTTRVWSRACWLFVLVVCALACGDSAVPPSAEPPEIDEISYEVFPTTRVLTKADLESLVAAPDDGTLVFSPAPAALADLTTGMVLVGGQSTRTPRGLLRGVGDVTRDGDTLTLRTMVVPIQVAFKRLSLRSAHRVRDWASQATEEPKSGSGLPGPTPQATDGTSKKNVRWVLFDGDDDESTLDDQVRLEGELGGGFVFDARFEVNWGAVDNLPQTVADCLKSIPGILIGKLPDCTPLALLPEAKATFDVGPDLTAHADLIGSASLEFEKELALVKLSLTPIPIGPIVLVPGVDVLATLSGSAGARFRTGFDADLAARLSLVASTKNGVSVTPPRLERSNVTARETELAIMAKGRLSLGARISLTLYGIIGPYAQVNGFAELAADTSKNPCWEIAAGLSANAGLLLTTPRLPVIGYVKLFDLKTPTWDIFKSGALASGSCGFGKEEPLPGVGPGEQAYGKPSFATWSQVRSVEGEAYFARAQVLSADLAYTQLERTTDGRFVVAGMNTRTLQKIDEAGALTWSKGYATDEGPAVLGRLATLLDASLLVATQRTTGPAVLRLGEEGTPLGAAELVFPADGGCTPGPVAAVKGLPRAGTDPEPAADYLVTGPCTSGDAAYVIAAKTDGRVVAASLLRAQGATSFVPRTVTVVDGAIWWFGNVWLENISHVAGVKMDRALAPQVTTAYVGSCENNRRLDAAFARPAALRSEVLVVGSSGADHEGLLLRLRPDGTVAVGTFPSYGPGASDVAVLQTIAELPTTGYVVGGTHWDALAPDGARERVVAPFLAWLDSGGSVFAAKRFTLDAGDVPTSSPRLELTNDGGLLLATTRDGGFTHHDAWTFKAFAKDGTVDDPRVATSPLPFKAASCGVSAVPLTVTTTPLAVTQREIVVSVR